MYSIYISIVLEQCQEPTSGWPSKANASARRENWGPNPKHHRSLHYVSVKISTSTTTPSNMFTGIVEVVGSGCSALDTTTNDAVLMRGQPSRASCNTTSPPAAAEAPR